ncbi:hypothetical protein B0O99DRAFT_652061 [Bisporella sp. PMI_857]|nr:hypothetical protein B0O99DRAFT_652061 [Bisporella sp. PMI_857]
MTVDDNRIDWNGLQYVQFVTTPESLCDSLMIWSKIEEIGSRGQRKMYYPSEWDIEAKGKDDPNHVSIFLRQAVKLYYVNAIPLEALNEITLAKSIWGGPYTNLLAFNLTQYSRVLVIDPASVVQKNLDLLFLIPPAPIAMPFIYWGKTDRWHFSTQLMLIEPSAEYLSQVADGIKAAGPQEYVVDTLTKVFNRKIIKIPQRPFGLSSGEYRRETHHEYMDNRAPNKWDPDRMLKEAAILHFSDYPIPKPWIQGSQELVNQYMPKCRRSEWFGGTNCRHRQVWLSLYSDYAEHRHTVCGKGFEVERQKESPDMSGLRERLFQL